MEATIRSPNQHPSLPPKSITTLFDNPNFPLQNPNYLAAIQNPIPDPAFVFVKHLTRTDVAENRVLIGGQRLMCALTPGERHSVETDYLRVMATMDEDEGDDAVYDLRLSRYASGAVFLRNQWKDMVHRNGLIHGNSVVGYGFRNNDGQFRLVIKVIRWN